MKFTPFALSAALCLAAFVPRASAHIILAEPKARVPGTPAKPKDDIKWGVRPCGGPKDDARITKMKAGQKVTFKWMETVFHDGYFRIELDTSGDDSMDVVDKNMFDKWGDYYAKTNGVSKADLPKELTTPTKTADGHWVLLDYWGEHSQNSRKSSWETAVTLPDGITCKGCTLRLTQVMAGRNYPSGAFYFHCADIDIEASGNPTMGGAGGTSMTSKGGAGGSTKNAGGEGGMAAGGQNATTKGDGGAGPGGQGGEAAGGDVGTKPPSKNRGGQGGLAADGDGGKDSGRNDKKAGGGCTMAQAPVQGGGFLLTVLFGAWFVDRRRRRGR